MKASVFTGAFFFMVFRAWELAKQSKTQ